MTDLAQLERQTSKLLTRIEGWSSARLNYRPAPEAWSAAEVFDHIVKTEEGILHAARQGVAKPHRIGFRDRLGNWFLTKLFGSDRRVKVPASASQVLPDASPDLQQVLQRWQSTRKDLSQFCDQLKPEQAPLGIFRHPVAGWMTMQQILEFFSVHMKHHEFQLLRLRKDSQAL